jgi:hypothetical protein
VEEPQELIDQLQQENTGPSYQRPYIDEITGHRSVEVLKRGRGLHRQEKIGGEISEDLGDRVLEDLLR